MTRKEQLISEITHLRSFHYDKRHIEVLNMILLRKRELAEIKKVEEVQNELEEKIT